MSPDREPGVREGREHDGGADRRGLGERPGPDREAAHEAPGAHEPPWWRRTRDAEAYREAKRRLDRPMLVLAVVFAVALVIGEAGDPQPPWRGALAAVNALVWLAFAAEYGWLLRLAEDRREHVRTHVLDLVIIVLPFLRPLRAVRALRLLRLFSVVARAWQQVVGVMRHRGLGGVLAIVSALLVLAGLVVYALEPQTFDDAGDAVWWVLVTSSTVGYGDFAPVGMAARAVAVVVMVLGVGLVGLITANIVDFLIGRAGAAGAGEARAGDAGAAAAGAGDLGPSTGCSRCAEQAARLERIEAQLELLTQRLGEERSGER